MPFAETDGVSIHYALAGDGPSVVLLHELGGSLESWEQVQPGLAARCRVLSYDQRGFGQSEKVRVPFTLDTHADDLAALLRTLELPPPYRFVTVAAAAGLALRFGERRPKDVAAFVFCNPAAGVDPARAEALEAVAAQAEREGMRSILPAMLGQSYPPELSDAATYERYRGRYLGNDPVCFAFGFRILARTDMRPALPQVSAPTMVVYGRQDYRPRAVSEGVAQQIPGARFEAIDAGHFLPVTNPAGLLALLTEFFA